MGFKKKKKKQQVKSPSIWSRVPEIGSDPPIGSDRESGRDVTPTLIHKKVIKVRWGIFPNKLFSR